MAPHSRHILTVDRFYSAATELRSHFEDRFNNPRDVSRSDRFVWDYWYQPHQYRLLRTPAYTFFPKKQYESLHRHLVDWGRKTLGCWDISPPWLSYYVDGCRQHLHADIPHGPWAYVFSLSPWTLKGDKPFMGGETVILKPSTLNYWQNFSTDRGLELPDLVDEVPSPFNRLTVFDPRLPHGVNEVRGPFDPRDARLVVHGWFTRPRPFIDGPMPARAAEEALNERLQQLGAAVAELPPLSGVMSWRIEVSAAGKVLSLRCLSHTVIATDGNPYAPELTPALNSIVKRTLGTGLYPKGKGKTSITIPLLFE